MQQELAQSSEQTLSPTSSASDAASALPGEVVFVSAEEQLQRSVELMGDGALVVTLPPPLREVRGRLGELLEELVERELARHGAPSPYLAAWSAMPEDASARLEDQLARAREVGGRGIALILGSLAAISRPTLSLDDSSILRWLAGKAHEAPLTLVLDDSDVDLLAHPAPAPLAGLLRRERPAVFAGSARAETAPALESEPPPFDGGADSAPITVSAAMDAQVARTFDDEGLDGFGADEVADEAALVVADDLTRNDTKVAAVDVEDVLLASNDDEIPVDVVSAEAPPVVVESAPGAPAPRATLPSPIEQVLEQIPTPEIIVPVVETPSLAQMPMASLAQPGERASRPRRERATVGIPVSGPSDAWRSWAVALTGARGAQPLGAFERLFVESYVPLANAIADGLDDTRALRAFEEFRRSFERSYTDAFATFGATNRRPRLVMDAFDIATKQARLANARSAHILVVDSMRWDLGCLVRDALARESQGAMTLTSESLLWSALPTTTMRQLETFARGMDALRAPADTSEEQVESLRGRASEVVRRLRCGSRELYKLDVVPAMLESMTVGPNRAPGSAMLEEIASATAECIARHVALLPARTLLFIVGDHGFAIDRRGELHGGGASPEEVLMPAQSWLVGALH